MKKVKKIICKINEDNIGYVEYLSVTQKLAYSDIVKMLVSRIEPFQLSMKYNLN